MVYSNTMLPFYNDETELGKHTLHVLSQVKRLNYVFNNVLWKLMLITGVLVYGSYSVLVHLCEKDGRIPFSSSALVLFIEISKFVLSVTLFFTTASTGQSQSFPPVTYVAALAVPAVLYAINNNIAVHMQLHMDPTTYQVLSNMKTATTAIFYRLIMKRELSYIKWLALTLLLLAGVFDSYGGYMPSTNRPIVTYETGSGIAIGSIIHVTVHGLQMMVPYCVISGIAGVYTEYVLKSYYNHSIHMQNAILYAFGIVMNFTTWLYQEGLHSSGAGVVLAISLSKHTGR